MALVASDGFLIAADTRRTEFSNPGGDLGQTSYGHSTSKIFISKRHGVMAAIAEEDIATEAAQLLMANLDAMEECPADLDKELRNACEDACKNRLLSAPNIIGSVIVINQKATQFPIIRAAFGKYKDGTFSYAMRPSTDKLVCGVCANSALFFLERYYKTRGLPRPLKELIPLSGHVINTASRLSPDRISGLQIVVLENGTTKPRFVQEETLREIQANSDQVLETVEQRLFNPEFSPVLSKEQSLIF